MNRQRSNTIAWSLLLLAVAMVFATTLLADDTMKLQGIIKSRSGPTLLVQTSDGVATTVLLTDSTSVGQVKGVLKVRKESMSMAALIPGLPVQVEGALDAQGRLVAKSIKFKGDDLQQAKSIQAGLWDTKVRNEQQQEELEKHSAELQDQQVALKQQQEQLTEQDKAIARNKAAIAAGLARFGQLDDYYILNEVTVYFPSGKSNLDPKYNAVLMQLAEDAKTYDAYMIQVIGYASASGGTALNQKLSEDRAHAVTVYLTQQANVPLMNMLAPGAMGESRQLAAGTSSADVDAANRRVVVRVLQNKGIAGAKPSA